MIRRWVPRERVPKRVRVKDTADFFRVDYDDVVVLEGIPYFVRNNEREGRFGLDDEQKFWVKRAGNLLTGELKVLKWVFRERFEAKIGNLVFECVRSPQKEARILELVRGRPEFMQGTTVLDSAGQPAPHPGLHPRQDALPDRARTWAGPRGFLLQPLPHRCSTSISGSSRPSVFFTRTTRSTATSGATTSSRTRRRAGTAGSISTSTIATARAASPTTSSASGTSSSSSPAAATSPRTGCSLDKPDILDRLTEDDVNIVFHNRVNNLKKIYPYIPEKLNRVLMHFSAERAGVLRDDGGTARGPRRGAGGTGTAVKTMRNAEMRRCGMRQADRSTGSEHERHGDHDVGSLSDTAGH